MKLAIIGSGNVGRGIGAAAVRAGHDVVLTAADPANAAAAADAIGATAASSNPDAVTDADVVVLAVPYSAAAGIVGELGERLAGTVLVDATNPLNESYSGLATDTSAAEEIQAAAPAAKVVKAFNTIFAVRHADPAEGDAPLDAFGAGDDDAAKDKVADLARSLGYRWIDAGGLGMARALEQMAFLNISLNARNGWPWRSGWKLVGPTG